MAFCKICTGLKRPGTKLKIVVNLKRDIVCRRHDKDFDIKSHKKKGHKKFILIISKILAYDARPNRVRGIRLPDFRNDTSRKKEDRRVALPFDRGSGLDIPRLGIGHDFDMGMRNHIPLYRTLGL